MPRARILLADDEQNITALLTLVLEEEDYEVCCCYTGKAAFDQIKKMLPDVVLVDMQMEHRESGFDVIRWMRDDPATQDIPTILYSADGNNLRLRASELLSYNCRMIEKPFDLDALLNLIESSISKPLQEKEA